MSTEPKTEPKAEKSASDALHVLDTTATVHFPTRTHEMIVDGQIQSFTFKAGEKLVLAAPIALRFLKEESFVVTDPETGKRIRPVPKTPDGGAFELGEFELVARLDELSTEALLVRCRQEAGGEKLKRNASRESLLEFLGNVMTAKRQAAAKAAQRAERAAARDTGDDLLVGDSVLPMSPNEADALFANA